MEKEMAYQKERRNQDGGVRYPIGSASWPHKNSAAVLSLLRLKSLTFTGHLRGDVFSLLCER